MLGLNRVMEGIANVTTKLCALKPKTTLQNTLLSRYTCPTPLSQSSKDDKLSGDTNYDALASHLKSPPPNLSQILTSRCNASHSPPHLPLPSPSVDIAVASYTKFNTALTAGLLNPMSPPPQRCNPTLFDMMSNEHDYHPARTLSLPILPSIPAPDRQSVLNDRLAEILSSSTPATHFNHPSGDVRLTLTSKDNLTVSLTVHRHILATHSRFFAAKLSDRWSKHQRTLPHLVDISDCEDVLTYVETLHLMYCNDLRRTLMREDVTKVLGILKVSAAIVFDAGVLACLEYLEAAPWAEDEEEKVALLLSQLHLESAGAGEVLKRVSLEAVHEEVNSGEEILVRLLQVVAGGGGMRRRGGR